MIERAKETPRLGGFLRAKQPEIIARWALAVRALPIARTLDRPRLVDHLPKILSLIADLVDEGPDSDGEGHDLPGKPPDLHAIERLDAGYDLGAVVTEYTILRQCVLELWEREWPRPTPTGELGVLNRAIDQAVILAVSRFTAARQRTLEALDRVSSVAVASGDLQGFLTRLLEVVRETTEAVDTVAILLKQEDGRLHLAASVGLAPELSRGFVQEIGEGFAGKIAAETKPLLLRDGSASPLLLNRGLRERGLRVLYGVPLVEGGEVVGVAHMGSQTAADFSEQDRLILRSMAGRATGLIVGHQLAAARAEGDERLRLAVEATGLGTWDENLATHMIQWSDRCRAIFGIDGDEPLSYETFLACLHPDDRRHANEAVQRALEPTSSGKFDIEFRVVRPDGTTRWVASRGRVGFDESDGVRKAARFTGTVLDITDSKKVQSDRELLVRDLDRAVKARDEFVAVLSHDLRNPIGAIALGADLLIQQLRDDQVRLRKRAQTIRTAAERAGRMIEDLLQEIALEGGQLELSKAPQDARGILAEVHDLFLPGALERGIQMRLAPSPGPLPVCCDRDAVLRALGNLVGNAKKFTPRGGRIDLRADLVDGGVRLSVSDTGPGISAEHRARLFERGFRGDRNEAGLGLGLSIAQRIVRAHGGTIGVESEPGKGSTFWFKLPLAAAA